MGLSARFMLQMTLALALVMAGFGYFLFTSTRNLVDGAVYASRRDSVRLMSEHQDLKRTSGQKIFADEGKMLPLENGRVKRFDVQIVGGTYTGEPGYLYRWDDRGDLLALRKPSTDPAGDLYGLFVGGTVAVVLVGAAVAFFVASQVTKPLDGLVTDVRAIGRGNLRHRAQVHAGGEVGDLARQIDRMADALGEAQEAEIELGMREREREVAQEVREALLPEKTPTLPGYDLGNLHVGAPEPGGDFHDFIRAGDRLVLIVCDVSGTGIPGALVGAMARAYLRSELERGGDLETALKKINRNVARDMRRGMYVTALCVVLDPQEHVATVACAGHKVPLVRYSARDGKLRLIQPEGIALGFDKGPVFDRSLELVRISIEPGDRLVLSNTGPLGVLSPEGEELGEKAFFRAVARNAAGGAKVMLKGILAALEKHAGEEPFPADISLVSLSRDA